MLGSLAHDILQTPRNGSLARRTFPRSINRLKFPCGHERFEQLFDEKGIALGEAEEGVEQISIDGVSRSQDSTHHVINLAAGERTKREFLRQPFAIKLGQPLP